MEIENVDQKREQEAVVQGLQVDFVGDAQDAAHFVECLVHYRWRRRDSRFKAITFNDAASAVACAYKMWLSRDLFEDALEDFDRLRGDQAFTGDDGEEALEAAADLGGFHRRVFFEADEHVVVAGEFAYELAVEQEREEEFASTIAEGQLSLEWRDRKKERSLWLTDFSNSSWSSGLSFLIPPRVNTILSFALLCIA